MKYTILPILILGFAAGAQAQGLLGVLPKTSAEQIETKPITFGVSAHVGWDSNVNTTSANQGDEVDSPFVGGSVSLDYRYVTERTVVSLGATGGANYYFDQVDPFDEVLYNLRVAGSLTHAFTDRLSIDDKFYVGYESEPNYIFGSSINRRSDEYMYAYNDFSVNYLWTDRLTSSTSVSVQAIDYEEDIVSGSEDRVTYGARQLFRYAVSEQTGMRAEYRYQYTDYDNGLEATRHYALVGFDHQIDEYTMLMAMVGVEFYEYDLSDETLPYGELGISRALTEALSLRIASRYGMEDVGLGTTGYRSNKTWRTNADLVYQISEKLRGNVGASYLLTEYDGNPGIDQDLIEGRVGLTYALTAALDVFCNYSFTSLTSDNEWSEYDRHRVMLGVNATF